MTHNEVIEKAGYIEWLRTRLLARPWMIALAYLLALTLAEVLTILIDPRAGMILYGLILIALFLQAAFSSQQPEYRFLVALSLVPLIRLVSLSLPLTNFPLIYWYALVGVPLFIAAILCVRLTGLQVGQIGLRFSWRDLPIQLLIGLTGPVFGYIEYLILSPDPFIPELRWELLWLPTLILLLFTGFLEELIFRGVMQTSAVQLLGRYGILFVALVFTVLHLGYGSILNMVLVFTIAIFYGVLVHRFGSLLGVSISHGLTNITLYLIYPFLFAAA
jgi:membrane protease YdiL (CAAX protease family)